MIKSSDIRRNIREWLRGTGLGMVICAVAFFYGCGDDEEEVGSVTVGDIPSITLMEVPEFSCEENGVLVFTLDMEEPLREATTLTFMLSGTATHGEDYVLSASALVQEDRTNGVWLATFLPLTESLEIVLEVQADDADDDDETLIFTLQKINEVVLGEEDILTGTSTFKELGDWDEDGFTDICSATQLAIINDEPDGDYEISGDIDFSDHGPFTPITVFNGVLEGNGYSLLNFSAGVLSTRDIPSAPLIPPPSALIAIFGRENENAEIRNLGIVGIDINHDTENGTSSAGFIGWASGGKLLNCFVRGVGERNIIKGMPAGGLVANINNGDGGASFTAENCYVLNVKIQDGASSRLARHGGLVGNSVNSTEKIFQYCYAAAQVGGGGADTGGLAGRASQGNFSESYWDKDDKEKGIGGSPSTGELPATVVGLTKDELRCPVSSSNTTCHTESTIYEGWSNNHWDFGSALQFPILKTTTGNIMRNQPREEPAAP